jgi:antitoxin (DNA-binding transcriptional repressor) of toxin-antitoxin stability system
MLETIPIHKAKSTLSQLIKRAEAGEIIYLGGYGKAQAALCPMEALVKRKPVSQAYGCMKSMILPQGWDGPLSDDVLGSFFQMRGLEDFEKK